jgi:magnesium chelatase subunit H
LQSAIPDKLWLTLLETEDALIPDGLHVVGREIDPGARAEQVRVMAETDAETRARIDKLLAETNELPALLNALGGHFIAPVAGGDLIRSPDVLPTGRNIHAFDPFRMPTAFALADGARQAELLLATHASMPRSVALVLWGSDNIKSDGGPIAQALALMGAKPRFDSFGRLCGADLIPLEELGRPRIDVVMTLSGIFRDLLPLQTKMLAEAAYKAAMADEPVEQNFVRAHALAHAEKMGCDLETAAVRVFSNAEGAYGSNVNQLVDAGAWNDEDELAEASPAARALPMAATASPGKTSNCCSRRWGPSISPTRTSNRSSWASPRSTTISTRWAASTGRSSGPAAAKRPSTSATRPAARARCARLQEQVALETRSRSAQPEMVRGC